MVLPLSQMIGLDIYSTDAEYIGRAYDFVLDLERGVVDKITLRPLRPKSKKEAIEILTKYSVPYYQVVAVKDIILIDKEKLPPPEEKPPKTPEVSEERSRLRLARTGSRFPSVFLRRR